MKRFFTKYPVLAWGLVVAGIALVIYAITRMFSNNGSQERAGSQMVETIKRTISSSPGFSGVSTGGGRPSGGMGGVGGGTGGFGGGRVSAGGASAR